MEPRRLLLPPSAQKELQRFQSPAPYRLRDHLADFLASAFKESPPWAEWAAAGAAVLAIGGTVAALKQWWTDLVPIAIYIFGPLSVVLVGAVVALAAGMRSRISQILTAVDADRVALVQSTEQSTLEMVTGFLQAQDEAAERAWTPEIVAAHVYVEMTPRAIFREHNQTRKPFISVEWKIICVAKIACDIAVLGGELQIYTLPVPGRHVVTVPFNRVDVSFDGRLLPGSVVVRKERQIWLDPHTMSEIESAFQGKEAMNVCVVIKDVIIKTANGVVNLPSISRAETAIATPR